MGGGRLGYEIGRGRDKICKVLKAKKVLCLLFCWIRGLFQWCSELSSVLMLRNHSQQGLGDQRQKCLAHCAQPLLIFSLVAFFMALGFVAPFGSAQGLLPAVFKNHYWQ